MKLKALYEQDIGIGIPDAAGMNAQNMRYSSSKPDMKLDINQEKPDIIDKQEKPDDKNNADRINKFKERIKRAADELNKRADALLDPNQSNNKSKDPKIDAILAALLAAKPR